MKINWESFINKTINVVLTENYGLKMDSSTNQPYYEISVKYGNLIAVYDEGIMLETFIEDKPVQSIIFFPYIKYVEIIN